MALHDCGCWCLGNVTHVAACVSLLCLLRSVGTEDSSTCVYAARASESSPSLPGNLAIASINLAAAIWEAEAVCSENNAWKPFLSFTWSRLKTTLPL